MAQTTSVRMGEDTKRTFDAFFNAAGMNVSAAFNQFAKTVVYEQRIPFKIEAYADSLYGEKKQEYLQKAAFSYESDIIRPIVKTPDELEAMENDV